mmetsp:Transcript_140061/g.435604  ORF Transcript_140061/g.435604 Transcript_140061/m.435604 type:complete len:337 (-) Transcript_140061:58-1068(-)
MFARVRWGAIAGRASTMAGPVAERVRVRRAANVICLRCRPPGPEPPALDRVALGAPASGHDSRADERLFGRAERLAFTSGWEVLLAQNEVQNWLRSTPQTPAVMRYPGEWKFAGGGLEEGEVPLAAVRRELEEELGVQLPAEGEGCRMRLLCVRQTRPVNLVSNIIFFFVALEHENPWLAAFDPGACNSWLAERRRRHQELVSEGEFWRLSKAAKEQVSPEQREVQWLPLHTAVAHAYSAMTRDFRPVNAFQQEEFARLGRKRRDPMFVTMDVLLTLEDHQTPEALRRHCDSVADPEAEVRRAQWIFEGMSASDVDAAMARRENFRQYSTWTEAKL